MSKKSAVNYEEPVVIKKCGQTACRMQASGVQVPPSDLSEAQAHKKNSAADLPAPESCEAPAVGADMTAVEIELRSDSIHKLLMRYALPCIISMVVNSVYNIVDQVFIGQNVGFLGNAASNTVFPLVCLASALAILFGEGGAVLASLNLGRGAKAQAEKVVNQAIGMVIIVAVLSGLVMYIFSERLLLLFGASGQVIPYAFSYGKIIILGLPLTIVATALGSLIRADGSPRFAMISLLSGAVLNIVLDYLFVVVWQNGVAGAAWATVLSQLVNLMLSLAYIPRFKNYRIKLSLCLPNLPLAAELLGYAVSSAMAQLAIMLVVTFNNNALVIYGAQSLYGADIPLAAFSITMKVNSILVALTMGIASGAQPIISYNYGAGDGKRVKNAYLWALTAATLLNVLGFAVFQLRPEWIINIFGQENELYNEFAKICFRIFLFSVFTCGVTTVSGVFLQAVGHRAQAGLVLMSRQILLYLPLLFILPHFFGLMGIVYTGAVADFAAFVIAVIVTFFTLRRDRILSGGKLGRGGADVI